MDKTKKDKILHNETYDSNKELSICNCKKINNRFNNINNFSSNIFKFILFLTIFSFIFILQLNQISSIGITPGRTTVNFVPGLSQEISFSVINTEHKEMNVVFFVQGELNGSISLKQLSASFSSSEESKSFSYIITLPKNFDSPGLYSAEIVALELPKDLESQGTFVGATVAVTTQVHVYVPYPDKYLEGTLNVVSDESKILFLVPVVNRGKLDIVSAKAVIDVYTALNEKVATIESESVPVSSLERKELLVEWEPDVNPGRYLASVTIIYDNEVASLSKEFNVGESLVDIEELYVRDFSLGEIAKFNALVDNKWSNEIKDSYLNILVYNNEGEIMADLKSPNYNLAPLSKTEMTAYWDTGGVSQGTYDGKVILKYGEKSSERNIELDISESNIEISGITGKVLVKGTGGSGINSLLVILIIVLVVANIIWFFVVRKYIKKRK